MGTLSQVFISHCTRLIYKVHSDFYLTDTLRFLYDGNTMTNSQLFIEGNHTPTSEVIIELYGNITLSSVEFVIATGSLIIDAGKSDTHRNCFAKILTILFTLQIATFQR